MSVPPLFSVLIPAHNQSERLDATLDSIARSEFDLDRVEVIVVDDASTDGTYETFRDRSYPFAFRIERVEHANQSMTTNEAIRRASGTYVLSSAHDILFEPNLFREHLKWHERFDGEDVVVLGYLPYSPHLETTPFMFYLVSGGYQFAYFLIRDPRNVPPNFLYAPNFSVRLDVLRRVGGFDERFPFGCQDTDLGLRLAAAGTRIVYNRDAVGFHNHPVEIESYCGRQETVGSGMLHLERKHPTFEGGLAVQDMVITQYLMCSRTRLDHVRNTVRRLESELDRSGMPYQELWNRAFCRLGGALEALTPEERRTLRAIQQLFESYQTILGFHWSKGYLDEAVRVDGAAAVASWVRSRLIKGQASIQTRRTVRRRLRDYGIEWTGFTTSDYRVSRVVCGLEHYEQAVGYLEEFQNPPARTCNCQLILVVDERAFTTDEIERLRGVAEVVAATDRDRGVVEALSRCRAELVNVTSSSLEPARSGTDLLVEKLFERIPELSVLGGSIAEADGGARYGYHANGVPLVDAAATVDRGLVPVDVTLAELCWIRGSALAPFMERVRSDPAPGGPWNHRLCTWATGSGRGVCHVPELDAYPRDASDHRAQLVQG